MTRVVTPIGEAERRERLERARRLMAKHRIDVLLLEPGTSLSYFTGVGWGLSERPFLILVPAEGELTCIYPAFEEARARERLHFPAEVRVWQEDESPYDLVAGALRDHGLGTGRVGVEDQVRFFVLDGLRSAAPAAEYRTAAPVTVGCRMIKTAAEIALMQRASDLTIAAFRASFATMRAGMTQDELSGNMLAGMERLGGSDPWALVGFGAASAFPHGSSRPQHLREGDIVLMDAGCALEGYQSDITRTTVFGRPSRRQTEIWNLERRAQDAAFAAARIGATCESVDAAARKVITDAGFGPGYKVPGLPHRTGHGIGMDGHESPNFVRGNTTILEPGMCFSDEPTIAIYGEFGIRLEDCLHLTPDGARFFRARQSTGHLDEPLAFEEFASMQASGTVHLFRLVHVLSGAFWFGAVIFLTVFLLPSLRAVGPAGGAVMEQLTSVRRVPIFMMAAAILTILSGWALYARDSGGFTGPWLRSGAGIVFGFGGVAGTLGAIAGMAITSPAGKRMGLLAAQIRASGAPPSAGQLAEMQALQARIARGSLIVTVLVVIALTAMAVARYVA